MGREAQTKARHLIDGASFGPEALKAIGEAFDAAWAEVSGNFGDDLVDVDKARRRLAKALLSIANEDSRDVAVLKRAALQRMALDYRRRS
jgi:ribosomal protein S7